ncbi:MAG: porin [Rhodocyclales bacterium]|nr:porin [Rhodocyclales bacterium]
MKKAQKKLIALAVASLASAPLWAQSSSIQFYGAADAFVKYGQWMGDDVSGVDDGGLNGSRVGFRGEEALGSGLKAVFVLEQGFNIDNGQSCCMSGADAEYNGGSQTFTRQAYVGLKGSFGQVALGRQYAPGYFIDAYDALLSAVPSPQSWLSLLGNLTITPNSPARWNNAVAYDGVFQSVSLSAIYSAGNRETDSAGPNGVDNDDDDKYGVSLKYDNGPLKLGAIYHGIKYSGQNVTDGYAKGDDTQKEWLLGASYNFGMATLAGSYQQGRDVLGASGFDVDLWQVGVIVPVGAGNIHFSYGQADIDEVANVLSRDVKPKSFTIAYTHAFSKRTTGYLGYNKIDYDDLTWNDAYNLGQTDSSFNGHSGTSKVDDTDLFFVGMSHSF